MSNPLKERILGELGREVIAALVRRAIGDLRSFGSGGAMGEESGLQNIWEEVCAQVQHQESWLWETYLEVVRDVVAMRVEELPPRDRDIAWLATDESWDWCGDVEAGHGPAEPPILSYDIVELAMKELLDTAGGWSNARIRKFLDEAF